MKTLFETRIELEKDPIAKAILILAQEIRFLGNANAATEMGAIEGLGVALKESAILLAEALAERGST